MRRKSVLGPIAILLAMLGAGCDINLLDEGPAPAPVVVTPVLLAADGTLSVPENTVVVRGDSVLWLQEGGDSITIHLDSIPTIGGPRSGVDFVVVVIPAGTEEGNYKYDVTVWRGGVPFRVDPRLLVEE